MKFLFVSFAIASITTASSTLLKSSAYRSESTGTMPVAASPASSAGACASAGAASSHPHSKAAAIDPDRRSTLPLLPARAALMRRSTQCVSVRRRVAEVLRALALVDHDVEALGVDELEQDLGALLGAVDLDPVELLDHAAVLDPDRLEQASGFDRVHLHADHLPVCLLYTSPS